MLILRPLGRTGRAGKQGTSITFLNNDDDEVMCVFRLLPPHWTTAKSLLSHIPQPLADLDLFGTAGTISSKVCCFWV